ncbi:MAG: hypothetical protein KIG95_10495, partial [Comamonas sp.]|nr:hypothetical protein [Comamonas sp.]
TFLQRWIKNWGFYAFAQFSRQHLVLVLNSFVLLNAASGWLQSFSTELPRAAYDQRSHPQAASLKDP